jgi:hypothetical protein
MPLQSDIASRLVMGISIEGQGYLGGFSLSSGLRHSERLAEFLRTSFNLGKRSDSALLGFWAELHAQGFTLETLYDEVCRRSAGVQEWAPFEFEAIVRTLLTESVDRSIGGVCDCHRALVRALEPGDFIVNFNWDTLASDALYHFSRLWFPVTGSGPSIGVLGKYPSDSATPQSHVWLLHPHGSNALYSLTDPAGIDKKKAIYVTPETYDPFSSMFATHRVPELDLPDGRGGSLRTPSDENLRRFKGGWIHLPNDEWLKPLFVPPAAAKPAYADWYHRAVRRALHQLLPRARRIFVIGYSVPSGDAAHVRSLFVPDILDPDISVAVINPSNDDETFRARIAQMFPSVNQIEYPLNDFIELCRSLLPPDDRRHFRPDGRKEP